jgi:hypothetical protein
LLASFAEKTRKEGIKFAYHNHSKEFEKFGGENRNGDSIQ